MRISRAQAAFAREANWLSGSALGAFPFALVMLGVLVVLIAFPQLSLVLL